MQIVIDIEEDYYKIIQHGVEHGMDYNPYVLIANSTPLPKGHGRLISADNLIKSIEEKAKRLSNTDTINGLCGAVALIFDAPTIIETD